MADRATTPDMGEVITEMERALLQIAERDTEIKALQAEVDDWRSQLASVLAEPTHKDGTHCTCVLFLRRQLDALRAQLSTREKQYTEAVQSIRDLSASSKSIASVALPRE